MTDTSRESMSSEMVFDDLTPIVVPITLAGVKYRLVEPERQAITTYKNRQAESIRMSNGDISGFSGSDGFENELLGACLYPLYKNEATGKYEKGEKPVGTDFINRLKNSIAEPLIERLKLISGLKAEEERLKQEALERKKRLNEGREGTNENLPKLTSETGSGSDSPKS